jgi:hypothetical protein
MMWRLEAMNARARMCAPAAGLPVPAAGSMYLASGGSVFERVKFAVHQASARMPSRPAPAAEAACQGVRSQKPAGANPARQ